MDGGSYSLSAASSYNSSSSREEVIVVGHPRFSSEEIGRRGQKWYEKSIRDKVETPENIGKLLSIDIETGDYEIGDDSDLEAPLRLHARHPGAAVYTLRIGYDAAVSLGGVVERTTP
jgi:hypothetical protein